MSVYLDYAATTPLDDIVLERMLPYLKEEFGNPSSVHVWGQRAEWAVEEAREAVARGLGCRTGELIFTSGGSESDNLALRGAAFGAREARGADHLLISPVEHEAVRKTALDLASTHGFDVEWLTIDKYGRVDPDDLRRSIQSNTALVSVIYGNNEIGTVNPISELAAVCRELEVAFHSDALQATSQLPTRVGSLGVDLLSIGAHKFYGPKGVGALYVRQGLPLQAAQSGGPQEHGLRAGTHNVPLIVGLGHAHEIAMDRQASDARRFKRLRDDLIQAVVDRVPHAQVTGHRAERLPNHASFVFDGVDGNALLSALDLAGYACSSGSACKTGDPEPSEVLTALGLDRSFALGSLRVTVGRQTTETEIKGFVDALPEAIASLRSPVAG